ncbi:MAG: magnesium transporter MgtE [Phycisphaerae bacterium]|nr:MAG: magnesium transporter MgtE [Phycisphaerae bacterium]
MTPTAELLLPEVEELIREGQYSDLRDALAAIHPADVADILGEIEPDKAAVGFRFLQRDDAAAAFAYLSPEKQEALIAQLGNEGAARVVEAMRPDDRARLVDELPEEIAQRVMAALSPEERKATQAILGYPEGTVGRLMTPDYVRVRPHWSVAQALDHVRKWGKDAETIAYIYVIDNEGRLIDDMRLRGLLLASPDDTVESQMNRSFVKLQATDPQEEAVRMMARYDRFAMPVVDSRGVLVGIVTSDDVADVAQAEATEDIQKMGGVAALEEPYMQAGHVEMYKKRGVWLAALFVGQTITILVLGGFQKRLEQAAVIVLFMPLVMSCGGNSGSQAATLVTRALALGEITPIDWWRIIRKEFFTAAMLGGSLALMGWACVEFFAMVNVAKFVSPDHAPRMAATVAAAIFTVVMWGTTLGSLLPLLLRRAKLDPAAASSPMVATLMDASGTLIYLGAAITILSGTVL